MNGKYKNEVGLFGFKWGPMVVERTASDERLGWVLTVRDRNGQARVEIQVSPEGKTWRVKEVA